VAGDLVHRHVQAARGEQLARRLEQPLAVAEEASRRSGRSTVVVAFAVATPVLPKQRPAPVEEPGAPDAEAEPAPVLVH
jgi:hypothetical protein